jgi:hypothetical protein
MSEKDKAFDHQVGESLHWQVPPPDYARQGEQVGRESTVVDIVALGAEVVQAGAIAAGELLTGQTLYERQIKDPNKHEVSLKKKPKPKDE